MGEPDGSVAESEMAESETIVEYESVTETASAAIYYAASDAETRVARRGRG